MMATAAASSGGCSGWVRPLGLEETRLNAYQTSCNYTISHALWLSSTTPLTHSNFSDTLWALYRRAPNLRLCVRTHSETKSPWYHQMEATTKELLDLEEVRGQRFSQVYQQVMHTEYPLDHGPLWCVRYLDLQHNLDDSYVDPTEDDPLDYSSAVDGSPFKDVNTTSTQLSAALEEDGSSGDGVTPKDKALNPHLRGVSDQVSCVKGQHRYIVIFGFSHVITDGVTNMRLSHHFLHLLNQELRQGVAGEDAKAGKVVEVGVFLSPVAEEQGLRRIKSDPVFASYKPGPHEASLYMSLYPPAATDSTMAETETVFLPGLTVGQTRALRQECRAQGVTVTAAFTAAATIAMLQLLHDAPSQDSRVKDLDVLRANFDVDLRRYWTQPQQDVLGLHASNLNLSIPTPAEPVSNGGFWRYAKQLHTQLKEELTKQLVVQQVVCDPRYQKMKTPDEIIREGLDPSLTCDYFGITNLGDLTSLLPGTGDPVELTSDLLTPDHDAANDATPVWLTRVHHSTTCHFSRVVCQHTIHTFRGRLLYHLNFFTTKMRRKEATKYASLTLHLLLRLSANPSHLT